MNKLIEIKEWLGLEGNEESTCFSQNANHFPYLRTQEEIKEKIEYFNSLNIELFVEIDDDNESEYEECLRDTLWLKFTKKKVDTSAVIEICTLRPDEIDQENGYLRLWWD